MAMTSGDAPPSSEPAEPPNPPEVAKRSSMLKMQKMSMLKDSVKDAFKDSRTKALASQFIAGIILIIATTVEPEAGTKNWAYSISVAVVNTFFSLLITLLMKFVPASETALFNAPVLGDMSFNACMTLGLGLWSGIGAGILTFNGPFIAAGNGYFAVWAGVVAATYSIVFTLPSLQAIMATASSKYSENLISLVVLGVADIVLALELELGAGNTSPGQQYTLGLIVAILTGFVVLFLLVLDLDLTPAAPAYQRAAYMSLFVLWVITAPWLTFTGPFITIGNGYFALWVGLASVAKLTLVARNGAEGVRTSYNSLVAKALEDERATGLWGQCVAGGILTIAVWFLTDTERDATNGVWGYAIAVGIVGFMFGFAAVALHKKPIGAKTVVAAKGKTVSASTTMNFFLFLWWGIGVGVITTNGTLQVFPGAGNGYFAVWAGFLFSTFGIGVTYKRTKEVAAGGVGMELGLLAGSIACMLSLGPVIGAASQFNGLAAPLVLLVATGCPSSAINPFFATLGFSGSIPLGEALDTCGDEWAPNFFKVLDAQGLGAVCNTQTFASASATIGTYTVTGADACGFYKYIFYHAHEAQILYGISIAGISVLLVLVLLLMRFLAKPLDAGKIVWPIFFVLWAVLAPWLTFTGPFISLSSTANGYFGSWGGLVATTMLMAFAFLPPKAPEADKPTDDEEAVMVTDAGIVITSNVAGSDSAAGMYPPLAGESTPPVYEDRGAPSGTV